MKIVFSPQSNIGKRSVWLSIFFLLIAIFLYITAELLGIISSDTLVSVFAIIAVIAQIAALVFGVIAVFKHKDHSILVYSAILLGIVVLMFIFGDMLGLPDI